MDTLKLWNRHDIIGHKVTHKSTGCFYITGYSYYDLDNRIDKYYNSNGTEISKDEFDKLTGGIKVEVW